MKKVRLGKDIALKWDITTNGKNTSLVGRDLVVELKAPNGVLTEPAFNVSGNRISFSFYGIDQKQVGVYSLTLWENRGKIGQNAVDAVKAFELVRTSQEEDDFVDSDLQVEDSNLETADLKLLAGGAYDSINPDTLFINSEGSESMKLRGKTYGDKSFAISFPIASTMKAGIMSATDKEHANNAKILHIGSYTNMNAVWNACAEVALNNPDVSIIRFDVTTSNGKTYNRGLVFQSFHYNHHIITQYTFMNEGHSHDCLVRHIVTNGQVDAWQPMQIYTSYGFEDGVLYGYKYGTSKDSTNRVALVTIGTGSQEEPTDITELLKANVGYEVIRGMAEGARFKCVGSGYLGGLRFDVDNKIQQYIADNGLGLDEEFTMIIEKKYGVFVFDCYGGGNYGQYFRFTADSTLQDIRVCTTTTRL